MALLTFDDVTLVPQYSDIATRDEVDISVEFGPFDLKTPLIAAPMDTVTSFALAEELQAVGGLTVYQRYCNVEDRHDAIRIPNVMPAVGSKEHNIVAEMIDDHMYAFCIDVAHGHHIAVKEMVEYIKKYQPSAFVMAGNICTESAAIDLVSWGVDALRVGVGGGAACTTRIMTGHGIPLFESIRLVRRAVGDSVLIVADGGIRQPGDAVKALGAGADAVMMGSVFARCPEAPGNLIEIDGRYYKQYRGMASVEARKDSKYVEGRSGLLPLGTSVRNIVQRFNTGIKSGLSYSGARNLKEFREKADFCQVSANTLTESETRLLR